MPTDGHRGNPPHILVVDDEDDVVDLVRRHLADVDCQISVAYSGEEGLAAAYADPPDLVVLDIILPGMDGRDVVRALRADERTKECAILVITVLDREDLKDVPVDGVLSKPFRRATFQEAVAKVLGQSALP